MFTPHLSHNKFPETISAELPLLPSAADGAGFRERDVLPRSFPAGWSIPIFYPLLSPPHLPSAPRSPCTSMPHLRSHHPRKKNRHAPNPFPIAILMTNAVRYLTIRARRMNTGNTFRISASAIAQQPAKIPAKRPNTARKGAPRGTPMWKTYRRFPTIPPSATQSS